MLREIRSRAAEKPLTVRVVDAHRTAAFQTSHLGGKQVGFSRTGAFRLAFPQTLHLLEGIGVDDRLVGVRDDIPLLTGLPSLFA